MDAQDVMEFAGKVSYAFAIIVGIIVIALIWHKITGHSPDALDLVLVLQGASVAGLIGLAYRQGKLEGKMGEFNQKFSLLATDFKAFQSDARKMQFDIKNLQADVAEIKRILSKKGAA